MASVDPGLNIALANPGLRIPSGLTVSASTKDKEQKDLWNSQGFQDYLKSQKLKSPFDINSTNPTEQKLATDWYKKQQSLFIDNGGQPQRPEFQSQIDPATGLLKGNLQMKPQLMDGVNLNTQALDELRKEGTRTGPSAWSDLMKKNLSTQSLDQLDKNNAGAMGANATALSNLAMKGGLNSGARTSLAKSMSHDINTGAQSINRNLSNSNLGVDLQDETNRLGVLSQLPGMELQSIQPALDTQKFNATTSNNAQQSNIQNAMGEKLQERGYDVNSFNELMKAWAAGKTADATASSGKK